MPFTFMAQMHLPVILRAYQPSAWRSVCPVKRDYMLGVGEPEQYIQEVYSLGAERMQWLGEQDLTFAIYAEVEDRSASIAPGDRVPCYDRCEPYDQPSFTPEYVIHYLIGFPNELGAVAWAMRWRGSH